MDEKQIGVRISDEDYEILKKIANTEMRNFSQIVRMALKLYIEENGNDITTKSK